MKELLLKGESLQKRVPDQDKREQLRLKHNQLNSKYNTVKVKHTPTVEPGKGPVAVKDNGWMIFFGGKAADFQKTNESQR